MAAVPPGMLPVFMNITDLFNSAAEFDSLLTRIGLNPRCRNRIIDNEGTTSSQELAETRPKYLNVSLENINKLFGSKPVNQRIYFAPRLMAKIIGICVCFRRCLMTHRILDVRVIDNFRVQEFVLKLEEWDKEEGATTNSSVKISDFKFDQRNFTTFNDKLVTLLSSTYGCRNCTLKYIIRTNKEPFAGHLLKKLLQT